MTTNLLKADIDLRNMARWSAAEGHPDPDRALHCLLYHTFGSENVPRAFAAHPNPDRPKEHARLLAYTRLENENLHDLARNHQSPLAAGVMSPFTFQTTPLPDAWLPGTTISFTVRVVPTYRVNPSGAERDVHRREDAAPTRQESYCNWLARLLQRNAGATPLPHTLRVTRYSSRKVTRSTHTAPITVPDVTIAGSCTITDPEAWANALLFGIGRHKAFGYGMLLLRPVQT